MISKKDTPQHKSFLEELSRINNFFTDSHAHIHALTDAEADAVLARAVEHKVCRVITIGTDIADSKKAAEFAAGRKNVYAAVGVHPHEAENFPQDGMEQLKRLLKQDKVIALGEIGLDFFYDYSPKDIQEKLFADFLCLAHEQNVPVIIHNRDSTDRLTDILKSELPVRDNSGIIHCFNGDINLLRYALDSGFYISYAGVVTFTKSDELRNTIKFVPRDRLLIETDSPYLTPVPFRGRVNEPAFTAYTAETVAAEAGVSLEKLAEILEENLQRLFNGAI